MRIVIKLGGHIFPSEIQAERIRSYAKLFRDLRRAGHELVVVVGGGERAREYIKVARRLGASEAVCDEIGIRVTRLNAMLFICSLGENAYPTPLTDVSELRRGLELGKIVFMGGVSPGHSTDAVAAIASEVIGADMLIRTIDVDGIYTADPKKDPRAKKLERISPKKLAEMILAQRIWAGNYPLLDPVATKIIERSKIVTWVVNGKDPANIERVIRGEHVGTLIG